MDTNLVKTFLSLAETRNFNKTAEMLYISQPTVTMRIKQLEQELGQPLFDRDKRSVELTAAGYNYLQYANKIIRLINESQLSMKNFDRQTKEITISAPVMTWDYGPFRGVIMDFLQKYSDVSFHMLRGDTYTTSNYFSNHTIDVGVVYIPPSKQSDMEILPLYQEKLYLVEKIGSGIRSDGNELRKPDGTLPNFIHLEYGTSATNHLVEDMFYNLPVFFKTDHSTLHLEIIKKGLGVGLLPESIMRSSGGNGLGIVDCDYNQHPLLYGNYLIYRKSNDEMLNTFINYIMSNIAKDQ